MADKTISKIFRNIWWVVCWSPSLVNISKARRVNEELLLIHLILISNYINRLLHILVCFFRLFELYIPSFVSPLPEVWTASNIIPTLEECFMANVFWVHEWIHVKPCVWPLLSANQMFRRRLYEAYRNGIH